MSNMNVYEQLMEIYSKAIPRLERAIYDLGDLGNNEETMAFVPRRMQVILLRILILGYQFGEDCPEPLPPLPVFGHCCEEIGYALATSMPLDPSLKTDEYWNSVLVGCAFDHVQMLLDILKVAKMRWKRIRSQKIKERKRKRDNPE